MIREELIEKAARAMHADDLANGVCAHEWGDYPNADADYRVNARAALDAVADDLRAEGAREAVLDFVTHDTVHQPDRVAIPADDENEGMTYYQLAQATAWRAVCWLNKHYPERTGR